MELRVSPEEQKAKTDVNEVEALIEMYLERTRPKQATRPVGWFEYQAARQRSRSRPQM